MVRVGNSLFALSLKIALFTEQQWAIRSCQPLKKSDHGQIALRSHRSLQKSDTRELLSLLFKKERREWLSLSLSITVQFAGKNCIFHNVFDIFSLLLPFLCPRENLSRRSLLRCSLQKSDVSKLLPLLFTKEWREQIASVALYKRVIPSFPQANWHFALLLTKNEQFAKKEQIPKPDDGTHTSWSADVEPAAG